MAVAGVAGTVAPAAAQSSMTPRQYYDGLIDYTYHNECLNGTPEVMTGAYAGYYGTNDVTWPRVGDVYYVRVGFGVLGNICSGGVYAGLELLLPPQTSFAISAANPVYCYFLPLGGSWTQVTDGCPQAPQAGGLYGSRFNPTVSPYAWPVANYSQMEVRIPVVSSVQLNGSASNHYVQAAITPQVGLWQFPYQGVFVAPNDLIHYGGFESGTFAGWTAQTDGGDLYVASGSGALRGSVYGIVASVDDQAGLYVQNDSPNNAGRYRMRFYIKPFTFNPGEEQNHRRVRVFLAFDEPSRRVMAIVLRRINGQYSVSVRVRRDDDTQADTSFHAITSGEHAIEVDWQRATGPGMNNGTLRLWIDDSLRQTLTGIDNDAAGIDFVRMGTISLKTGAMGMLVFDEMESRTTTAVGP